MSDLSNGWLAKNQQQKFPLDPRATGLTDDGRSLPDGLLADLSLTGYMIAGVELFITAVRCNETSASVAIGYLYDSGNPEPSLGEFTVVTVARGAKTTNNDKLAVLPATTTVLAGSGVSQRVITTRKLNSGLIAFGDPSIMFSGVFSSPQQTRLAASTYRYVQVTQAVYSALGESEYVPPYFTVSNLDGSMNFNGLFGTIKLESGLDMSVTAVDLLSASGVPLLTPTQAAKRGILITGSLANNLIYLPKSGMADEDDCSAAGYPPAIKTIGGVTPKATPNGGEMLIEFSAEGMTDVASAGTAVDGYAFSLPGEVTSTSYTPEQLNVTTMLTSVPFGSLCKTPVSKPVPVVTACSDVADEVCDGVHTFEQIPIDWSVPDDLPLSSTTPRLTPGGAPCPDIETLEDELITDYGTEFGTCFAPVARGQSICQRWYSRRVWAFDQTTQLDKIQIGSLGMSYAPTDWDASDTNLYSPELKAAFLGMPLRNYLDRSLIATFQLDPGGAQSWSRSALFSPVYMPFYKPIINCLGSIILDASVDTPFGADFKQPPSAKDDGLRRVEATLTFGLVFGSMVQHNDFVDGRSVVRTGYWLVQAGDRVLNPAELLLETDDLDSKTVMLSVFAQRDTVSHEIYGTVGWTIPNVPDPAVGTRAFRTAPWARWAGEQIVVPSPQSTNRIHLGFSIGPNTTIMALEA